MTKLSVNINKIATLRNARGEDYPNLVKTAKDIIKFGAEGITIHPRPDERHIKYSDSPTYGIRGSVRDRFLYRVYIIWYGLDSVYRDLTLVPEG